MNTSLVIDRLRSSAPLQGLGLEQSEGRIVVAGLALPRPRVASTLQIAGISLQRMTNLTHFKNLEWRNIEFRNCDLSEAKVFGGKFENCVFDRCKCSEVGFWKVHATDVRFVRCDLRAFAAGGVDRDGPLIPNLYDRVVFDRCDMRRSAHSCEQYRQCAFLHSRLDKVDFMGAVFADCRFEGPLRETTFRSHDPEFSRQPANRLMNCDLTKARLDGVTFIGIDLDLAMLPDDPSLLRLPGGREDLLAWQQLTGLRDIYIEYLIQNAGIPSVAELRFLNDLYTPEQVGLLKRIAAGDIPS